MEKIIIVESPSKSKTIETYVGHDFKVLSSKGHIRDLATSGKGGLGVDVENGFIPNYVDIKEKKELIDYLIRECKGKQVYLATDPDREGEAISWHLAKVLNLNLDEENRIEFNEITKPAVLEAFNHVRKVNMNLVKSQEARRILDRIIGFKLSTMMQRKIKQPAAGRVQSVALKLIVDLEHEIRRFVPVEYWTIDADFGDFKARLESENGVTVDIKNELEANIILSSLTDKFIVKSVNSKESFKSSSPAYITSTLLTDASSKLGFDSKRTMRIAQGLYEGKNVGNETIGLITYMRTDSDRLSNIFVNECKEYINYEFGPSYLGNTKHKESVLSQDAHEAIRPTYLKRNPESIRRYLTDEEYKLYSLIYARSIASLMSPAVIDNTDVLLNNNNFIFKTNGSVIKFDGYLKIYKKYSEYSEKNLPKFYENDVIKADAIIPTQNFTKPKSRYTEATLIKEMEKKGIGRPSTYAQTIDRIKTYKYVEVKEKKFIPTDAGIIVIKKLDEFFSDIINVKYTADMEKNLDDISSGNIRWDLVLSDFYDVFMKLYDYALDNWQTEAPEVVDGVCPQCGGQLVKRTGKNGEFIACGNFPKCKYIKGNEESFKETGEICPNCGHPLVIKKGRYGEFVACSNYPTCKYIKQDEKKEVVDSGIICPKCKKGHLVQRKSSKGKTKGMIFYACDNFPKCRNSYFGKPTGEVCSECNNLMIETEKGIVCSNNDCITNKKDN